MKKTAGKNSKVGMGRIRKVGILNNKDTIIWLFVFALSVMALFGIRAFMNQAPDDLAVSPVADVWLQVALVVFLVGLITTHVAFRNSDALKASLTVGLFSVFMASLPIIMLHGTPYALNGVQGDQSFRTASITKFATTWKYIDFAYKDLPSFYPPLYYYILGRTADIFGLAPYAMSKIGLIATTFVLPFVIYGLWRPLVGREIASLVPFVLLMMQNWYKPSGMLSSSIFIPWWFYFIDHLPNRDVKWWQYMGGGIIGSLAFQVYYFWFFAGGVGIILDLAYRGVFQTITGDYIKLLWKQFLMLATTALFSAPFWLPFLMSMARTGGWKQMQTRDCGAGVLYLPFFEGSVAGLLMLVGMFYLLASLGKNHQKDTNPISPSSLSEYALRIIAASYFLVILGYAGYLADRPFKPSTTMFLVEYILLVSCIIAIITWGKKLVKKIEAERARRGVYVLAGLLFVLVSQKTVRDLAIDEHLNVAHASPNLDEFLADFERVTGDDNHIGKVVLADFSYQALAVYLPVNEFIAWNAHYSHPAGLFNERVAFLRELSKIENPTLFAQKLMNNPYDHIDALVLEAVKTDYRLNYGPDAFPYPGVMASIWFPQYLFSSSHFNVYVEKFHIGNVRDEFVIIVPKYKD
ncbi:MAG: arabinofuranosyltransferase [Chloroflexota bacterium]|nr:arabinofuranosyltransferase [Chloroflexota bacterium]